MAKPRPEFIMESLLAEMERDHPGCMTEQNGLTTREISEHFGICQETARKWVSQWYRAGRVRVVRKRVMGMSGVTRPVPSYIITSKEPD